MAGEYSIPDPIRTGGFALVPSVLTPAQIAELIESLENLDQSESIRKRGGIFAIRNLLDESEVIRDLAVSAAVRGLVAPLLGERAFPVRGILFDKTPGANWKVPWHQDVTIAVASRKELPGFGPWSTKAGTLHVQPPAFVLEKMLSVRLHLDPCDEKNGALKVVAGTHLMGRLGEAEAIRLGANGPVSFCRANAGDALLMWPLLLHASSASEAPSHRRVVHLDFAASELPEGLCWAVERVSR